VVCPYRGTSGAHADLSCLKVEIRSNGLLVRSRPVVILCNAAKQVRVNTKQLGRFAVLTAMNIKITGLWDMPPCSLNRLWKGDSEEPAPTICRAELVS
jgi:hypothetical protein